MVVSAFQNWINLFALHGNLALSPMLLHRPIHFVFICHRQGLNLKGLIVIVEAIRGHGIFWFHGLLGNKMLQK